MSKWSKWNMVCCRTMTHVLTAYASHAPDAPHLSPLCSAQPAAQLTGRTVLRRRVACHLVSMWVLFKIRPSMRAALPRPARITPQGVWTCVQHVVSKRVGSDVLTHE